MIIILKSNIEPVSNVYNVNTNIAMDKEFLKQVRGKKALEIMIEKLNGTRSSLLLSYIKQMLTDEQYIQYEEGMYCAIHGDKQELIFGYVEKNGNKELECRCYKHICPRFKKCRPNYDLSNQPQPFNYDLISKNAETDELLIWKDIDIEMQMDKNTIVDIENGSDMDKSMIYFDFEDDDCDYFIDLAIGKENPQNNVIKALPTEKMIVSAGPGTGKTYTLIKRIMHLVQVHNVNPSDMIVLSFSRAAISEINKRMQDSLDVNEYGYNIIHDVDIRTFDSFSTFLLKEVESEIDLTGQDYDKRVEMAIRCIEKNPEIFSFTQHIIVDEIQDLVGIRAMLVKTILKYSACGFTFFGDMCQAIYEYQVADKPNLITSFGFHNWLNVYYDDLQKCSFSNNYRQSEELAKLGLSIRKSIIHDKEDRQVEILTRNMELIKNLGDCNFVSNKMMFDSRKKYAFLCRNNGQVLIVSKILKEQNIHNTIQRPSTYRLLNRWLGEIFGQYEKRFINLDEFNDLSNKLFDNNDSINIERWKILKKIESVGGSSINLETLMNAMLKNNLTYTELESTSNSNIIVSTIHRAKGREYDQVIILDNDIFNQSRWVNISEEVRTTYVALTRPKERIYRAQLKSSWQRKIKEQRWISTGYNRNKNKPFVSHIEIGLENDIELSSFVNIRLHGLEEGVIQIQQYICNNIKLGDAVILVKRIHSDFGTVQYHIYHNDTCIGSMSNNFTNDLFQAFSEVQNYYSKEKQEYYPSEITEVYVDEICSYILHNLRPDVHVKYLKSKIWNGVYLSGLGKINWNN